MNSTLPLRSAGLALFSTQMATGMLAPKKRLGARSDDCLEQVGLDNPLADGPLRAAPEEDAVGHHHADHALGVGDRQHVQQEGEVSPRLRRDSAEAVEPVMRVVGREVLPPVLQAEGRIRDDSVVGEQPSRRVGQLRLGDDVAGLQTRGPQAVEQQVQLSGRERSQIALLAVEREVPDVSPCSCTYWDA